MACTCIPMPGVPGTKACFHENGDTALVSKVEFVIDGWNDGGCNDCRAASRDGFASIDVVARVRGFLGGASGLDRAGVIARCALDVDVMAPFAAAVVRALLSLPRGQCFTYGGLARVAGNPRAARAVGAIMRSNPLPIIIPCHRVLPASGGLGGFAGNKHPAMQGIKQRLLELDGCSP